MAIIYQDEDLEGEYMKYLDKVVKKEVEVSKERIKSILDKLKDLSKWSPYPWTEYIEDIEQAYCITNCKECDSHLYENKCLNCNPPF